MPDFSVRSDNVDVEQIMRQIRSRIREKRGVDYTEDEIRELANVKLEKFIDPKGVRSGLLDEYRRVSTPAASAPNYAFGEDTLYETHRGPIRWMRSLLRPFLKLLFNPNPLIQALHIQADLNQRNAERWAKREQLDALHYEVIHNLVVEVTRSSLEVKTLKMRLESMASRLDFDERRARALEGVVQYRPGVAAPLQPPTGQERGRHEHRRDQGPRHQGPRDQGPRDHGQRPQGPRPQEQVAQTTTAPADQPPGNALDNDGNERRARRRRRRGRRRGGEDRGPRSDVRGPETEDREPRTEDRGPEAEDRGPETEERGPQTEDRGPRTDDRASDSGHRTSDSGPRTSSDSEGAGGASTEPRSGDGRPPDHTES